MAKTVKKVLQEEYRRLKNAMEKLIKPKNQEAVPQLILQPVRDKKYLRGNLR
jgi:hypothetical protein